MDRLVFPDEITLEYVHGLPEDIVYESAMKYLASIKKKREWNSAYNKTPRVQAKQRQYYYVKNDIYHPEYNPEGSIEKRIKRT